MFFKNPVLACFSWKMLFASTGPYALEYGRIQKERGENAAEPAAVQKRSAVG